MSPHAIEDTRQLSEASAVQAHSVRLPFGTVLDPHVLRGSVYTSAATVISQTVYALASTLFSYETVGSANLVDAHLQLWAGHYKRANAVGAVPPFYRLEPRSGAGNAILGYASSGKPYSVVLGANALAYMAPTLRGQKLPLSLNVSAVDFDAKTQTLYSNYNAAVSFARTLGVPLVSPVDTSAAELQNTTIVNHFLAALTQGPAVHVFDGPEFSRTFAKFDSVLGVDEVGRVYQQLLNGNVPAPRTADDAVAAALTAFNAVAGVSLRPFEYEGHELPETVFVVFGAHQAEQTAFVVGKAASASRVGVIKARVPVPFNHQAFSDVLPALTKKLVFLDSALQGDATAALFASGRISSVVVDRFVPPSDFVWSPITVLKVVSEFVEVDPAAVLSTPKHVQHVTANTSPEGSYIVWSRDTADLVNTADKLALSLSLDSSKNVSIRSKYDTSVAGGVYQAQIASGRDTWAVDAADVVVVEDASILGHFDVLATARPGGLVLLVNNKGAVETTVEKLPQAFKTAVAKNHLKLTVIDFTAVEALDAASDATKGFSADFLVQVAFWRLALPELGSFVVNKLLQANGNSFELLAAVLDKFVASVDEVKALVAVDVAPWLDEAKIQELEKEKEKEQEEEDEETALPFFPKEVSFSPNPRAQPPSNEDIFHSSVSTLATKVAFPEAYNLQKDLRPDLPVKNFVVKVQENTRLTPTEYSRNIFHIEFDTTGTGLKYEIGEALGIHGRNTAAAVDSFLDFYGVNGDSLVEVANKDEASVLEVRLARQALTDNVDFLGKPPKRFYEALAPFASDDAQRSSLQKLATSEGAAELKRRQDTDFASYVDILEEFLSARPPFAELVRMIAPLKRREYSIASSQKVHPNAVHLLIVVVDWVDSKGRLRYGHCSKYLSDLRVGDELVVSVKPSVMKLPPNPEQPIVMSGLGTGLAPFKAFVEEKIWQQQQGHTIGEVYLFMGSRHKKEEYLYGELWEAYKAAGVLTHIGAAFSRDQPEKIYIQDKIRSSIGDLTDAIVKKNGSFYLCGPTWPVPDITACLEDIVQNGARREGKEIEDVAKVVEDMKEEGRYILEVY